MSPLIVFEKILVRNDCLRDMVEYQHGELLENDWDDLVISSERLLKGWEIDGTGYFTVRVDDPHVGPMVLRFKQKIHVDQNWMTSYTSLVQPVDCLKKYDIELMMNSDGTKTNVDTTVSLVYERRLPLVYVQYMNEQVEESARQSLLAGREAMLRLVDKYRNKRFIIPIRK